MRVGAIFLLVTALLVVLGCWLFIEGFEGWGQLLWVMGSGTAGAGCVMIAEHWDE